MSKPKLTKVSVKLPFMQADWEADHEENRVLRDLVDVIRTRRAFEINRGHAAEEPDYFVKSIVEAREELRSLLPRLPVAAIESRLLLHSVIDALGEILDAWAAGIADVSGRALRFDDMLPPGRFRVMENAWPKVQDVRRRLDVIVQELSTSLGL